MRTHSIKPVDIKKKWVVVDAAGQSLGRVASQIAYVLRGKHKTSFVPHLDCGDNVVVVNAGKVKLTGKKWDEKAYHQHSGYMGGMHSILAKDLLNKAPERLVEIAVRGMLPHNKLSRHVMKNLRVFAGNEHPHAGQNPEAMPSRLAK